MRLKVTNGDLLIVHHPYGGSDFSRDEFEREIRNWLTKRDLGDVKVISTESFNEDVNVTKFSVISVNDVFEDEVLKKE